MHETSRWERMRRASQINMTAPVIFDPYGCGIYFFSATEEPRMTTSPQANQTRTGTIKGIDLSAYFTQDPQRSIAFYRDVLGMVPTELDDEGRGAEFTLADGSTFGVWKPDGPATGGCVMLAVDDVTQAVAEFRARGAEFTDPDETPVCYMAIGKDPDGNTLIVHQRKTAN
jgi:predicted enzyme related to lactoylglutathione lyase